MKVALALLLPIVASAVLMKKPTQEQIEKRNQWKVATIEEGWENKTKAKPSFYHPIMQKYAPRFEILPTQHEVGGSKNIEIFWQRPNTTKVKGIFFGATGCFHQGGDFFEEIDTERDPKGEFPFHGCKKSKMMRCQGLPENVYSFKYALERGYLVMTATPQDKNSCWNHQLDPLRVDEAVKFLIHNENLPKDIPMYATGASQGGYMMFDMQEKKVRNLQCIAPQCAEMKWKTGAEKLPTMFIWMPKDVNLTNPIRESIDYLLKRKVKVTVRTPHAWKFHELMRARGYPEEMVQKVKERLFKAKGIFGHKPVTGGGHIIDHPGTDGWWKKALRPLFTLEEDSFMKDHSKIHHMMQTAFAEHEFTAEYTDHILDFCEGHEDKNKPLRFDRPHDQKYPSPEAIACSPQCPPPGVATTGPLSNFGLYLADVMQGKGKKSLLQK